ncbi:MAG: sodium transport system ATP-binding protein [Clostridiales bacterium]|jgi:sodium transport system ATP-binding protein|nr:sodium transport system ATP-binding protein [Clostridiales bacterium]MDN5298342.1 sodium transport system ATP-binding protein [Clostridiales bacterium]
MIEVSKLKKSYKLSKKQLAMIADRHARQKVKIAVNDLSFTVRPGTIFGLLGPNGAGKTTTLRCISTLLKPTDGTVRVMGIDAEEAPEKVRASIAFLTNDLKLDKHFTPLDTLRFFADLHRVPKAVTEERACALFDYFDITPFKDKKIGELSQGMMQKVAIAVSLIHDPPVIIFDEPTNGLDIITARKVTDYLKMLRDQGKTIIISTHIMTVAEKLCDEIAVILNGSLAASGTVASLLEQTGQKDLDDAFFEIYQAQNGGVS